MKNRLFLAAFISLISFAACQNNSNAQNAAIQTVSVQQFDTKLAAAANTAQLIDVRTPEEYAGEHLKNAVNININSDDFDAWIAKLDKHKPVFVYCKAGSRSAKAASKMQEMGFTEVYNMDGGIMKWTSAGKPVDNGTAQPKSNGLTADEFNKMIAGNKYVLVDYNAKWCAPCKKMLPVLESLAEKKKDKLSLLKIDADDNKDLLKQKGISGIPYLELYQNGKLLWKHDGYISEEDLLKETKL